MHGSDFPRILGTATINEKGQIVIPAEARASLGLEPGSRVVVMSGKHRPALIILKAEEVEAMLRDMNDALRMNPDTENA